MLLLIATLLFAVTPAWSRSPFHRNCFDNKCPVWSKCVPLDDMDYECDVEPCIPYFCREQTCKPSYTRHCGSYWCSCYKLHTTEMPWKEAHNFCREQGADLISVHSENENKWLAGFLLMNAMNSTHHWIGLMGADRAKANFWRDGSSMGYEAWKADGLAHDQLSEIDVQSMKRELCGAAEIRPGMDLTQWVLDNCFAEKPFLCKYDLPN